jgi:hypothetical protein
VLDNISQMTSIKIDAGQFLDDAGRKVETLPELNLNNNYFLEMVNFDPTLNTTLGT